MTHIGIDARLTAYRTGGISTYIREFTQALAYLQPPERITIFPHRSSKERITDTLPQYALWTPPHHPQERYALSAELLRHRLDVLHCTDFIPPQGGARHFVITVHDLTFLHYPQHKDYDAKRYYNYQIKSAVTRASHILAVSEATRVDLWETLQVPPSRVTVQPHGVNPQFKPLDQIGDDLRLPENYILFVGTLEPRKNIPVLLEAYAALPAVTRMDHPLVLAGHMGWLFTDTLRQINDLQARGLSIILRDDITDAQLPILYNRAAMLVLPSFYEGFGMPVLEAMACGTPVIVSQVSSLPEVAGDAGLLIDPNDPTMLAAAIQRALTDSEWRTQARERGLAHASKFTWERSAQVALEVYREVAARSE